MTLVETQVRILLLVEDNPGDAELVCELLEQADDRFQVMHVARIDDARRQLQESRVDVVVLDLQLPDSTGIDSVVAVRQVAGDVPIVVLTGNSDEDLAISCVDAGAQEYLSKLDMQAGSLRKSIQYAVARCREERVRELRNTLSRLRYLSTGTAGTTVTGAMAGSGSVRQRYPNAFREFVVDYTRLFESYLGPRLGEAVKPREEMERLVTRLGDASAGPRDLIDVHLAALDAIMLEGSRDQDSSLAVEGRLLALEMMGLLVDYYRTGVRRGSPGRRKS